MNQGLCGILCLPVLKGGSRSSEKQQGLYGEGSIDLGHPKVAVRVEDNKAGKGRAWASKAVNIRQDLLLPWPVAGNSDKPELGDFRLGVLHRVPQQPLQAILNCALNCNCYQN